MDNFTIYLHHSPVIKKDQFSPYHKDMKSSKCTYFNGGKITLKGELEYLFIGQTCDAIQLIECFKNKPRFLKSVHFTVIDYYHHKEVITTFQGTFIDALEFIAKYAELYVSRKYLSPLPNINLDDKFTLCT